MGSDRQLKVKVEPCEWLHQFYYGALKYHAEWKDYAPLNGANLRAGNSPEL